MKKLLLFQMLLMLALQTWAQRTVVSGTVVHAKTNEPVVGASVTMNELSVVTNEDGFFTLKSERGAESITVSHVGYRLQQVKLTGQPLKIRMQPVTIQLSEVLVMPIEGVSEELDKFFHVNVYTGYFLAQECTKMGNLSKEGGSIVFFSSVAGSFGEVGKSTYGMTKAALLNLAKHLACEMARKNHCVTTFNKMLAAYKTEYVQNRRGQETLKTDFSDSPIQPASSSSEGKPMPSLSPRPSARRRPRPARRRLGPPHCASPAPSARVPRGGAFCAGCNSPFLETALRLE